MPLIRFELWFASIWVNQAGGLPTACFCAWVKTKACVEVCWKRGQAGGEAELQDVGRARARLGAELAASGGAGSLPRLRLGSCAPGGAGSAGEGSVVRLTRQGFNRQQAALRARPASSRWGGRGRRAGQRAAAGPGCPRSHGSASRRRLGVKPTGAGGDGRRGFPRAWSFPWRLLSLLRRVRASAATSARVALQVSWGTACVWSTGPREPFRWAPALVGCRCASRP